MGDLRNILKLSIDFCGDNVLCAVVSFFKFLTEGKNICKYFIYLLYIKSNSINFKAKKTA